MLLDMSGIYDEETFHEYLSKKLNFPGYYGYNLNAFWDCITDPEQSDMPETLLVEGLAELRKNLPELCDGFLDCLKSYEKEYPERSVIYHEDSPSGEGIQIEADLD